MSKIAKWFSNLGKGDKPPKAPIVVAEKALEGPQLRSFPFAIVSRLTDFLPSRWVVRLWLAGDSALNRTLSMHNVVNELLIKNGRTADLPALFQRFPTLEYIDIYYLVDGHPGLDLLLLPRDLKSLRLDNDHASTFLRKLAPTRDSYCDHFRCLTKMVISSLLMFDYSQVFRVYPDTLTHLEIWAGAEQLPPELTTYFPKSLETLVLNEGELGKYYEGPPNLQIELPSNLTRLDFEVSWAWRLINFPQNLVSLSMTGSRSKRNLTDTFVANRVKALSNFPPSLKSLTMACKFIDEFASKLPESLTHLKGASNNFVDSEKAFAALPATLTSWPDLAVNNACLKHIPSRMQYLSMYISKADRANDSIFSVAPTVLTTDPLPPPRSSLCFPSSLTELHLESEADFVLLDIASLPATLTKLEAQFPYKINDEVLASEDPLFATLPRNLKWLDIETHCPITNPAGLPPNLEYLRVRPYGFPVNRIGYLSKLKFLRCDVAATSRINFASLPRALTALRLSGPGLIDAEAIRTMPRCLLTLILISGVTANFDASDLRLLPSMIRYLYLPNMQKELDIEAAKQYAPYSLCTLRTHFKGAEVEFQSYAGDWYEYDEADRLWDDYIISEQ